MPGNGDPALSTSTLDEVFRVRDDFLLLFS